MTPGTAQRPQMSVEEFEELARNAPENVELEFLDGRLYVKHGPIGVEDFEELSRRAPETVTLELINGKLEVKPVPDQLHGAIIMWLIRQCMHQRPDLALYPEQGLKINTYRQGHAKADGALVPVDHFVGQVGEWADPDGVLLTVEVTLRDSDAKRRDHNEKRIGYAEADIPVYLLVDRDSDTLVVYSEPSHGTYQKHVSYKYGDTVTLPDPVGITLDTEKLKDYAH
ncbi:Uma2 family endonuclease [Streptomyces ficellus]|uniref:Uma2 family endonuclease n=1 Tax=Streptomyces ficellus TaxID=1977088 RepID=A0A6I6F899_9ACTN|nr:Uma2 family endonuclease [Streptomyces ficellus]QGV79930.1 Uma2 family endonuclease [Streptomyces ficellus]